MVLYVKDRLICLTVNIEMNVMLKLPTITIHIIILCIVIYIIAPQYICYRTTSAREHQSAFAII